MVKDKKKYQEEWRRKHPDYWKKYYRKHRKISVRGRFYRIKRIFKRLFKTS